MLFGIIFLLKATILLEPYNRAKKKKISIMMKLLSLTSQGYSFLAREEQGVDFVWHYR